MAVAVALAAVAVAVVVVVRQHAELGSVATSTAATAWTRPRSSRASSRPSDDLTRADCDDPHDAEVLVMLELDADQAAAYRPVVPDLVCLDALDNQADVAIDDQRLLVAGVADSARARTPGRPGLLRLRGRRDPARGPGPAPLSRSIRLRFDAYSSRATRRRIAGEVRPR